MIMEEASMNRDDVFANIRQTAENVGVTLDEVKECDYINDVLSESLTFVAFIVELENIYDVEIPDEFLFSENMETFADLIDTVLELANA